MLATGCGKHRRHSRLHVLRSKARTWVGARPEQGQTRRARLRPDELAVERRGIWAWNLDVRLADRQVSSRFEPLSEPGLTPCSTLFGRLEIVDVQFCLQPLDLSPWATISDLHVIRKFEPRNAHECTVRRGGPHRPDAKTVPGKLSALFTVVQGHGGGGGSREGGARISSGYYN